MRKNWISCQLKKKIGSTVLFGKRIFPLALILVLCCFVLNACGEQICAYCGEEKNGKEYDILGTTRFICTDCLNNPAANILGGSVIQEYAATPISASDNIPLSTDYFTATSVVTTSENELSVTDNSSAFSDNTEGQQIPPEEFTEPSNNSSMDEPIAPDTSASEEAIQQPSSTISPDYNSIMATLNATYVAAGLQLVPNNEDNTIFNLCNGGADLGIRFVFTNARSSTPALSVQFFTGASSSDYTAACINAILAYIFSNDYNGIGYEIYNSTTQYGNYRYENCRFYYTNFGNTAENGAPIATFDISQ